ncbi:MAG: hypothetical protein GC162_09285 [Planctomycetes bacterium]|nr:hypothetical protein [Planctomycetota bacterium]
MNFLNRMGVLGLTAAALTGCSSAKVAEPLTAKLAGDDIDAQMEFWHTLEERPLTSNDEAFHAVLLFTDGSDASKSYDERVAALKGRKFLPANFDESADRAVGRGTTAMLLVGILHIKGGIIMQAFGPSPRYALRELQYLQVVPPSSEQQTFSGAQFVSLIGRAEDYQRQNPFKSSGGNSASQPEIVASK